MKERLTDLCEKALSIACDTGNDELVTVIHEIKTGIDEHTGKVLLDFAERLKKYYSSLNDKTSSSLVAFHIDMIAKELIEGTGKNG